MSLFQKIDYPSQLKKQIAKNFNVPFTVVFVKGSGKNLQSRRVFSKSLEASVYYEDHPWKLEEWQFDFYGTPEDSAEWAKPFVGDYVPHVYFVHPDGYAFSGQIKDFSYDISTGSPGFFFSFRTTGALVYHTPQSVSGLSFLNGTAAKENMLPEKDKTQESPSKAISKMTKAELIEEHGKMTASIEALTKKIHSLETKNKVFQQEASSWKDNAEQKANKLEVLESEYADYKKIAKKVKMLHAHFEVIEAESFSRLPKELAGNTINRLAYLRKMLMLPSNKYKEMVAQGDAAEIQAQALPGDYDSEDDLL